MFKDIFKSLLRDTFVYGLAGSVAKFAAIITMPIVLRILSKEEYGIADASITFASIFGSFIIFGQDSAIARLFYDKQNSIDYKKKVVSTGLFIQLLVTIISGILFLLFSNQIGKTLIGRNTAVLVNWKMAILILPGSAMVYFCTNLFKWTFQRNNYLLVSIGQTLLNVVLTIFCVAFLKLGVLGIIVPLIISSYLFGLIGLILNGKYLSFKLALSDFTVFKDMFLYGAPFFMIMLITSLLPALDRFFLVRFASLDQIGVYAVANRVASLLALAIGAFQIAFGPYAFSIWNQKEAPAIFSRLCNIYLMIVLFLSLVIGAFGSTIISLLASSGYREAVLVLPPLLMMYSVQGLLEFALLGILWSKKTYLNTLVTVATVAFLFVMNYFLVPLFTIIGAAVAGLCAKSFMVIISYAISNKFYEIAICAKQFVLILISSCVAFSLIYIDFYSHSFAAAAMKYLSPAIFCIVCFFLVLTPPERSSIMTRWNMFRKRPLCTNQ